MNVRHRQIRVPAQMKTTHRSSVIKGGRRSPTIFCSLPGRLGCSGRPAGRVDEPGKSISVPVLGVQGRASIDAIRTDTRHRLNPGPYQFRATRRWQAIHTCDQNGAASASVIRTGPNQCKKLRNVCERGIELVGEEPTWKRTPVTLVVVKHRKHTRDVKPRKTHDNRRKIGRADRFSRTEQREWDAECEARDRQMRAVIPL
eukprot:670296-Rhodomonas_salina.3